MGFTSLPGENPLEIANDRARHNPMHASAVPGLRDEFLRFLHAEARKAVPDLADYGKEFPRCDTAGQLLTRFLQQKPALDAFTGWRGSRGGYTVPKGK